MDTKQYLVEKGAGKGQFNLIVPLPSIVESTYIHVIMCVHDMYDASYTFTFTTCTHVHTTLLDSKNCLTIIVLVLKKFFIFILYTITTVYYYTVHHYDSILYSSIDYMYAYRSLTFLNIYLYVATYAFTRGTCKNKRFVFFEGTYTCNAHA